VISKDQVAEFVASFGLPLSGGVIGGAFASVADLSHFYGAALGAVAGLLSVGLRGWFRLKELQQQHETEAMKLRNDRLVRKLKKAGIDPDTE
jgi:hypothetical protein